MDEATLFIAVVVSGVDDTETAASAMIVTIPFADAKRRALRRARDVGVSPGQPRKATQGYLDE